MTKVFEILDIMQQRIVGDRKQMRLALGKSQLPDLKSLQVLAQGRAIKVELSSLLELRRWKLESS